MSSASAVAALVISEYDRDLPRVAIPHPAVQVIVRFGPSARDGLDAHAFGVQQRVRRKLIRAGQRAVIASLYPGTVEAILGVPADSLAGRVVELGDLWGPAATQRLLEQMVTAASNGEAARVLERAITRRAAAIPGSSARLVLEAAERLMSANVGSVAAAMGVSERHLHRVFKQAIGVGPKEFTRLMRFQRAISAAHADELANWASIAAATGYYDQAHLIGEFHTLSGVTPRALLNELRG